MSKYGDDFEKCFKCHRIIEDRDKCYSPKCDQMPILYCSLCQISQKLENCLREHEKRLEILEESLQQNAKLNAPTQAPLLCPYLPNTISRKAITITVTFVLFTIILGIILATTTNLFGKTMNKNIDYDVIDDGTLVMLNVTDWVGNPPRHTLTKLDLPVHRVIISHTAAEGCNSQAVCSDRVRAVQSFHRDSWMWDDIGYNFLIGGDGRVYVGRGWDRQGAHTKGYNADSLGISFIGTFTKIQPPKRQQVACQLLIAEGVKLGVLAKDYQLYGHRQMSATESPGELLYQIITKWPHWTDQIPNAQILDA